MSVFTPLTEDAVDNLTKLFGLDSPLRSKGITSGTVNSNFCLYYPKQKLILTLFEQLGAQAVDNYMRLQHFLVEQRFPCPKPLPTANGKWHVMYQGKPVSLVSFIPGGSVTHPSAKQCEQIGQHLAILHQQTTNSPPLTNPLGKEWREQALNKVLPTLTPTEQQLMQKMRKHEQQFFNASLPKAIIHNDCFKDNVHFEGEQLMGIIDFYYAATEICLWDICVVANDWCTEQTLPHLLAGYQSVRAFTAPEQALLAQGLALAAWHFWLYRLYVNLNRPTGSMISQKDPSAFAKLLDKRLGEL